MATKVLYIMASAGLGGAEKATLNIARNHSQEFDPELLFLIDGPLVEQAKSLGITSHVYAEPFRLLNPFYLRRVRAYAHELISSRGVGLAHFCMPYPYVILGPGLAVPAVLFQHGPVGGKLDKLASMRPPQHVFANSEYTRREHLKTTLRKSPVTICPLAPDLVYLSQHESKDEDLAAFLRTHRCIAMMGRFDPAKGLDFGLRALAPILKRDANLGTVVMGGRFGDFHQDYADFLLRLPIQLGIESQVFFTGPVPTVIPLLKQMDLFVHTTVIPEGFGLTILEAMASRVICVAADSGGVTDYLEDGKNGFLYQTGNQADLRGALEKALALRDEADVIRAEAEETVRRRYNIERMMAAVERVYRELLGTA